ncbi:hypothetical protein DN824_20665 [Stutzerimonas nosocomialis]|uniref:hypothetical protein n=1 Tax=Stutzerimonas nosocomialis TaxID=1056496 RepID=UPI001107B58C|nr:hypothetical protein [Stutzerimonas nosocomialis]TLX54841.1 hypothetical protein DN824_20665 [Stutzerimonas nosocomialis]
MTYSLLHLAHLLAAIFFIGALFFEVAILAHARRQVGAIAEPTIRAVNARSRVVLHAVAVVLYGAGLGLGWHYRVVLADPLGSVFGTLLALKVVLALGVFASFALVVVWLRRGVLSARRRHRLRLLILAQTLLIVVLAKAMFVAHG